MANVSSIDLHPDQLPGHGPEAAIRAARHFLDQSLKAGHREVRLITGLGLHGDGTPRLRSRIEQDVLPGYFSQIEQQAYEQGGAVIHLWLRAQVARPNSRHLKHERKKHERQQVAVREERLEIAYQRLEAAEDFLDENDLKKVRLKLNQVAREFGWPPIEGSLDDAQAGLQLDGAWARLKALDV